MGPQEGASNSIKEGDFIGVSRKNIFFKDVCPKENTSYNESIAFSYKQVGISQFKCSALNLRQNTPFEFVN